MAAHAPRIDHPHDDAADQQRRRHQAQALQVFADDLGEQEGRYRGAYERDERERERMVQRGAVTGLARGEGADEFEDAPDEEEEERENGAELNDDGVHLPVRIGEVDVEQRLRDPQVRGRADGQKLREALDDAEQDRDDVVVHALPLARGKSVAICVRARSNRALRHRWGWTAPSGISEWLRVPSSH